MMRNKKGCEISSNPETCKWFTPGSTPDSSGKKRKICETCLTKINIVLEEKDSIGSTIRNILRNIGMWKCEYEFSKPSKKTS